MPTPHLLAFVLAALVLVLIPGPSVLFVVGRSLSLGRRGGLLSVVGNTLGVLPHIVLVALGLGALVAQSLTLFTVVKTIGALYLIYLGMQAIRHRRSPVAATLDPGMRSIRIVREGFLVGVTNPKTAVFLVAVLPQFVDYSQGAIPVQLATLGLVFALVALTCDSGWALVAGSARQWFSRSPRRLERLTATGGVMVVGMGGTLLVSGAPD